MKRGDVFSATLEPRSGNEQRGQRLVVLISDDLMSQETSWSSLIVLPITTSSKQKRKQTFLGPTVIPIPKNEGGLSQESFVLCHQVTTLNRSKLLKPLGQLGESTLEQVDKGLKLSLGLL
jgi:mRNA interferase MazF